MALTQEEFTREFIKSQLKRGKKKEEIRTALVPAYQKYLKQSPAPAEQAVQATKGVAKGFQIPSIMDIPFAREAVSKTAETLAGIPPKGAADIASLGQIGALKGLKKAYTTPLPNTELEKLYEKLPKEAKSNLDKAAAMDMIRQFGFNFVNESLLGAPEAVSKKKGIGGIPEPQTIGGKSAAKAGQALGLITGATGKILSSTDKIKVLNDATSWAGNVAQAGARGGIGGLITGMLRTPDQDLVDLTDIENQMAARAEQAVREGIAYGAGNMVIGSMGWIRKAKQAKTLNEKLKMIDNADDELYKAYVKQMEQYGDDIDKLKSMYPDNTADASNIIAEHNMRSSDVVGEFLPPDPKVRTAFNTIPELKQLTKNPELASNLTVQQMDDIATAINKKYKLYDKGKYVSKGAQNREITNLYNQFKSKMVEAFPASGKDGVKGVDQIKKEYAIFMKDYNMARKAHVSTSFETKLADASFDARTQRSMNNIYSPEMINAFGGYNEMMKYNKLTEMVGKTMGFAALRFLIYTTLGGVIFKSGVFD